MKTDTTKDTPLTLMQASVKYDIALGTLRNWIQSGKLISTKLGRKHYVTERDIFKNRATL